MLASIEHCDSTSSLLNILCIQSATIARNVTYAIRVRETTLACRLPFKIAVSALCRRPDRLSEKTQLFDEKLTRSFYRFVSKRVLGKSHKYLRVFYRATALYARSSISSKFPRKRRWYRKMVPRSPILFDSTSFRLLDERFCWPRRQFEEALLLLLVSRQREHLELRESSSKK